MAIRHRYGKSGIITPFPTIYATAIGIVSRDCIATPYLIDGSDPGETWAAPIEDAYLLRLALSGAPRMYFGEAVLDRRVASYGRRALTAEVFEQDEMHLTVRFALPAT